MIFNVCLRALREPGGNLLSLVSLVKILCLSSVMLLTSCTTTPIINSYPPDPQQWQQHQQTMLSLSHWQMSGKVAMRNGHDGGQADVFWQQTDAQTYEIKLVAPFGAGSSLFTASPERVELKLSSGENMVASTVDELMAETPDWQFPVAGMRYWLLGIAAPQSVADHMSWDEQGRLVLLVQDGWRIELQNHAPIDEYILPRKIFMRRLDKNETDMKLIVRQWILP